MKTEIKRIFICGFCHKKYDTQQETLECEEKHKEENYFNNLVEFELKQYHLDLIKEMTISWDNCEFGAPCIDPKRPYGNSNVETDIADILGIKDAYNEEEDEWDEKKLKQINRVHKEMEIVLQIVLHCLSFKLGIYNKKDKYSQKWELKKNV